jgi:hypothetical protein
MWRLNLLTWGDAARRADLDTEEIRAAIRAGKIHPVPSPLGGLLPLAEVAQVAETLGRTSLSSKGEHVMAHTPTEIVERALASAWTGVDGDNTPSARRTRVIATAVNLAQKGGIAANTALLDALAEVVPPFLAGHGLAEDEPAVTAAIILARRQIESRLAEAQARRERQAMLRGR